MDFAYIASQTFGDVELERELLSLFAAQAHRLLLGLPAQTDAEQAETAHLLKGSARAVGASAVADAAEAYEGALGTAAGRTQAFDRLAGTIATTEAAIAAYLAVLKPTPD